MSITAAELKVRFSTDGVGKTKADINSLGQTVDSVDGKSQGFLKTAAATTLGFLGGGLIMGGIGQLKGLAGGFIMANASAETYRNQLEIAAGSSQKAGEIFTWLQKMAADTPFEFPELINAATQLESLGQSSQKWLPIIGDTAAATGKSVDQVTQAVLDAQTGEFERLKELGIRTKVEGDKVKFSFMKNGQEMVVEADNTAEGISNALMGIWSDKYTGAMDKLSSTFMGKLSTLKDNINLIAQGISKPLFDVAKQGLTFANSFISNFTDMLGKGLPATAAFAYAARQALIDAFPNSDIAERLTPTIYAITDGMETLSGVFSSVAGVVKSVLGAAFSFLADHIDLVVGAIKGVIAAMAVIAGWGAITAIVAGLGAAFAALLSPLGLLIGAFALLGMAWQTNFLGIQDKVRNTAKSYAKSIDGIKTALDGIRRGDWNRFSGGLTTLFSDLADHARSAAASIPLLSGPLNGLANILDAIPRAVNGFKDTLSSLMSQGLNPLAALAGVVGIAFAKLADIFPAFGNTFGSLRDMMTSWMGVFQALGDAITNALDGNWKDALNNFRDVFSGLGDVVSSALGALGNFIRDAFNAIDWSALWDGAKNVAGDLVSGLGDLGGALWDWVSGAAASIDWGSVWSTAQDIAGTVVSKLGDLGSALMTWVADAASRIDWGSIWSTAQDVASTVVSMLGDLASALMQWVSDAASAIDWSSVASGAIDIAATVVSKLGDLTSQLMQWVESAASAVDWTSIASGAVDIASTVVSRLGDLASQLMQWVVNAAATIDWGSIASNARDIASDVVSRLGDLGSALMTWVSEAAGRIDWGSILSSFKGADIVGAGQAFGENIVQAIGDALGNVSWDSVGFAIGKGIQGLIGVSLAFGGFVAGVIEGIASGLRDADWGTVGSAIKDAFSGLWDGLTDGMDSQIDAARTKLIEFVNEAIKWINRIIDGLNKIPGTHITHLELIPTKSIKDLPELIIKSTENAGKTAGDKAGAAIAAGIQRHASTVKSVVDNALSNAESIAKRIADRMKTTPSPQPVPTPEGIGNISRLTGNAKYDQTATVTINAVDNASGIVASLKANLLSIPPEKLTQLQQVGGEVVAGMSALVGAAIGTIPTSHLTALQQAGGEVVTGVAGIARAAVNAIPTAHLTAILQAGGEGVTAISNAAANAIRNIPTSHSTSISESGAAGVASAANAAAAAINAIPSVKSVAISVVVSGISAAQAAIAAVGGKWTGGFTDTPLTWLAEKGRELVQTPTGDWFMALRKSLFAVPLGSRVYSNPETERMMASMLPVPGYAAGGVVGGGGSSSLPSLGGGSRESLTYTDQRQYHITLSLQDTEELLRARQFFDNLEREAELAFGGGPF